MIGKIYDNCVDKFIDILWIWIKFVAKIFKIEIEE